MTQKPFLASTLALLPVLALSASAQPETAPAPAPAVATETKTRSPQEWRPLLVIKKTTHLQMEGFPQIRATLSDEDIAAVTRAFEEHTPRLVSELSQGGLTWKPTVVVSPFPVERVARVGEWVWLSPQEVRNDYEHFVTLGQYDGVLFYWRGVDDDSGEKLNTGFGWTIGRTPEAKWAGHSSVHYYPASMWGFDNEVTEVFLHEWLHQVEAFIDENGGPLPREGLHGADANGFPHNSGGLSGWRAWYQACLTGTIPQPDGSLVGLGDPAGSFGPIRQAAAVFTPEFLTPTRLEHNLLADPSFEADDPETRHWSPSSYRNDPAAVRLTTEPGRTGHRAVCLDATSDDVAFRQTVTLKPHTRYLLGGWVKTRDVAIADDNGSIGANLSVAGGYERSASILGDTDWTYLALVFDSNDREQVDLGPRLGFYNSLASGTAWFDDLVLIELPPLKPAEPEAAAPPPGSPAAGP